MAFLIKILTFCLISLEVFLLFLSTYLTIALIGLSFPINTDYNSKNGEIEIFVTSNGVHTDIRLPVKTSVIDWTDFIDDKHFRGINKKPSYIYYTFPRVPAILWFFWGPF